MNLTLILVCQICNMNGKYFFVRFMVLLQILNLNIFQHFFSAIYLLMLSLELVFRPVVVWTVTPWAVSKLIILHRGNYSRHHRLRPIRSVAYNTGNLYCICLNACCMFAWADAVHFCGKFWDTQYLLNIEMLTKIFLVLDQG